MAENDERMFHFQLVPHRNVLITLEDKCKGTNELLDKWGLRGNLKCHTFFYNGHFQSYQKIAFVKDFFKDPIVNETLQVQKDGSMGGWTSLNSHTLIDDVIIDEVKCSITSMELFDKLYNTQSRGVVRESGDIVKCFDETIDDFLISNRVQKMLLDDEDDLFPPNERLEFLFILFKHLVLGGPVNQYEDAVGPYLNTVKMLYKELISVVKDASGQMSISSIVLSVKAKVAGSIIFPSSAASCCHTQTFCYLIIDNITRHVTVLYHIW